MTRKEAFDIIGDAILNDPACINPSDPDHTRQIAVIVTALDALGLLALAKNKQ